MANKNKTEEEKVKAAQAAAAAQEQNPEHICDPEDWDKVSGEEYGGDADVLILKAGDVSKVIKYTGCREANLGLGPTVVHDGIFVGSQEPVRLPVSYMFVRTLDQSGVAKGDQFMIKRLEKDIVPKSGPQKGKAIPNYKVKVVKKSDVPF